MLFHASDEEKGLVHKAVQNLKDSLEQSAEAANELVSLLNENFLAISKDYRKELLPKMTEIDSYLWHLTLQVHNMNRNKERIIFPPEQKGC